MLLYEKGSESQNLTAHDLEQGLISALDKLGSKKKVLIVPPDFTRIHSKAGELTRYAYKYYGKAISAILQLLAPIFP